MHRKMPHSKFSEKPAFNENHGFYSVPVDNFWNLNQKEKRN